MAGLIALTWRVHFLFFILLASSRLFRPLWTSIFYEGLPGLHPSGQPKAVQIRSIRIYLLHDPAYCPYWVSSFLIFYCAGAWSCFSPFLGEYLFFEWPKKRYQKKGHPAVLAFGCSVRFCLQRALLNSLRSDSPRAIPL